ncbi:MAG: sigma-70 family RNA polymerase sigma factor [Actinomycetota bacterium]|nr:sigma-70 family RNA polymerase sigma factor [Rubrobacteraceae bacterium]MDQ3497113.1 sigma-70 family RNA polymerase sigma factor [Actinomycetota bacterium]
MDERDWLASRFEEHRPRLRAVAYRMLGSPSEAEDAVQEAWIRLDRSGSGVENLGGWLTTVVGRVCLNMLRSRGSRREQFLGEALGETSGARMPDPIVDREDGIDPEHQALLADGIGLALLVVLETLSPAERIAFVLHDTFGLPFDEIAPIVGRSPAAARQLASRGRRRVRGEATLPAADPARQREVVDAFLAASRDGDLGALLAVLDPDVVLRADPGAAGASREVRGAHAVAEQARAFSRLGQFSRRALVNGVAGIVSRAPGGPTFSVMGFTVARGKITEIDILADPERLRLLDLAFLDD